MLTSINVSERYGRYLSSREVARQLREHVVMLVERENVERVTVDFTGVESISTSFADSLLGLLVAQLGVAWLDRHVELRGLGREDEHDIAVVLRRRAP
jgi:hypothetical protein